MDYIKVRGAKEHNLKNIDIDIPKNKMVVITGVSGSGKSSLAFDTIFAEGQRRYIESLSSYARQFLGMMNKPNVRMIEGLSPSISIEQKTTSNNPRSTVGTVTEIYDYMRLLYARIGVPYCMICGKVITKQSIDQIVDKVLKMEEGTRIQILSPVIRNQKGEHKKVLEKIQKEGFVRVLIDDESYDLSFDEITLEKNKKHDINIIVDRLVIKESIRSRLAEAIENAMKYSDKLVIIDDLKEKHIFSGNYSCPEHGIGFSEISPRLFSFNSHLGACTSCSGIGFLQKIDPELIIPDKEKTLYDGVKAFGASTMNKNDTIAKKYFEAIGKKYGVKIKGVKIKNLPSEFLDKILYGTGEEEVEFEFESSRGTRIFSQPFEGVIPTLERRHQETKSEGARKFYEMYMTELPCSECKGTRLKRDLMYILVGDLNIHELSSKSIIDIKEYLNKIKLSETESIIAEEILKELNKRLQFLIDVGLGYLTLTRAAGTLSGGESQRIRLATQIGSGLTGVIYILDEPSIGLHQRDNDKLLLTLEKLKNQGNTLLIVEHDEDTMKKADQIIDIGPVAGLNGGYLVAQGKIDDIIAAEKSITGKYLSGEKKIEVPKTRRKGNGKKITIKKATENNLKNVNISVPLGTYTCVTGVSGSGKSSLINEVLYKGINKKLNNPNMLAGKAEKIDGIENIDKIINIDQSPIGKTPRSNPATYTGLFDNIRDIFAETKEAKMRGYQKGRFSFNVQGGRCESCSGDGVKKIEMQFLSDVYVPCEVCNGKRYNYETLEVKYKGFNISDVLDMTVEKALDIFENIPKIKNKLQILKEVGLSYIKLGQPSTTLSGGEAQRVKLATELSKRPTGKTLYVLDEPSTGLHIDDIAKLADIINRLVETGNTVVVIEHNLDLIKVADYIIDLGPEGGEDGGNVIAKGTPEQVIKVKESYTGKYLKEYLK